MHQRAGQEPHFTLTPAGGGGLGGGNLAHRNVCQSAAGREEGVGTAGECKVADLNGRIYGTLL